MRGENRALVADGIAAHEHLAAARASRRSLGTSRRGGKPLSATNLSFSLIPRLNAAGRMGDAQLALDLLMSDKFERGLRAWPNGWRP